jgi:hypothetical protein
MYLLLVIFTSGEGGVMDINIDLAQLLVTRVPMMLQDTFILSLETSIGEIRKMTTCGREFPVRITRVPQVSWSSNDAAGAFASPLKLVVAGIRSYSSGSLSGVGSYGYYWSSTVGGDYSRSLYFGSGYADMDYSIRAGGFSVRCLKD